MLILAVFVACGTLAFGRDVYVDNVAGDDRHSGDAAKPSGTGVGPCRTIARALRSAKRGDQIVLAPTGVPYRESITLEGLRHSGFANRAFVIEGNGAILDGSTPVPGTAWEHYRGDVFRFRPRRMNYQQLFIDDIPATRRRVEGDKMQLPPLEPRQWCQIDGYIYFRVEKDKLPRQYNLTHAGHSVGITLYKVDNVIVQNLIVQGYRLDGVNAHDGAFRCRLVDVTARGNGRSGVSIGGASRVSLERCVVGNNGAAQVRTEGYSKTEITGCDLIDNTAPPIVHEGGSITVDGEKWKPEGRRQNEGARD